MANYPIHLIRKPPFLTAFNPPGLVELNIYNLLGQEIRRLVNELKQSSMYTVRCEGKNTDGEQVSGGMYIYQLKVNDFVETKKMLMMK